MNLSFLMEKRHSYFISMILLWTSFSLVSQSSCAQNQEKIICNGIPWFDDQGRMLYGWVNESSERQTGDDAWKEGVYYLGDAGDGALRDNQWAKIDVVDDEQEDDDFQDYYWFYFKSNGKKTVDTTKKINGKKYRFTENGNAIFNWYATPSEATPASARASPPSSSSCGATVWWRTTRWRSAGSPTS